MTLLLSYRQYIEKIKGHIMFQDRIDEDFIPLESAIESSLFALEAGEVPAAQASASGIKEVSVRIADALKATWTKVIEAAKKMAPYVKEFMKNHFENFGKRIDGMTANAQTYLQNNAQKISQLDNGFQNFQMAVDPKVLKLKSNGIDISAISTSVVTNYFEPKLALAHDATNTSKVIEANYKVVFDKAAYPTGKPDEKAEKVSAEITRSEWAEARSIYGNKEVKGIFEKVQRPVENFQRKLNNELTGSTTKLGMLLSKCTGTQVTSNDKSELNKTGTDTKKLTLLIKETMQFSGSLSNLMMMKYRWAENIIKTGVANLGGENTEETTTETKNTKNGTQITTTTTKTTTVSSGT